jgi:sigma-B regulation protein RsbU (phosphoserine phosphatase)
VSDSLSDLRHDLRTPLNQIIGYSEMLEEEATEAGQACTVLDLKKIQTAARRLLEVINTRVIDGAMPATAASGELLDVPASPDIAEPRSPRARLSGSVLVVDDVDENRDMLARRLVREGLVVETAPNGRVALDMAGHGNFDLILLDILMPELDGYATLQALKADETLRHVPVIMISALDEISSVIRCIEAGAEDYLPKPFDPTLLRARIGACLEKKRLRDVEQEHVRVIEQTQARLSTELAQAANYVRSIIPEPVDHPVRAEWLYRPSTELGGDAFGYHAIDDDHFAMYLLDVCGHGVGPALLSVAAMNVIRSGALPGTDTRDPGAVVGALNTAFPMEKQNNMYFTIWYGVYHAPSRTLKHASGGHPPALLLVPGPSGTWEPRRLSSTGLIVGAMEDVEFGTERSDVPVGARLVVICDGCYEFTRPDGTMATFDDFEAFMRERGSQPDGLHQLLDWAQTQSGSDALEDDFSVVRFTF